jgi:hypothetical protein
MGDLFKLAAAWKHVIALRQKGFRIALDQMRESSKWKCIIYESYAYGWCKHNHGTGDTLAEAIHDAYGIYCDMGGK